MELKDRWKKIDYLQKQFEQVKNDFFPRWDRKQQWKLELVHSKDLRIANFEKHFFLARCDRESKTIVIRGCRISQSLFFDLKWALSLCGDDCPPEEALCCILIHEICHARTPDTGLGHGMAFQNRMWEVIGMSKELGNKKIEELLRREIMIARKILVPEAKKLNREFLEKVGREEGRRRRLVKKANKEYQERRTKGGEPD